MYQHITARALKISLATLAACLLSARACAGVTTLSDTDMSHITGESNIYNLGGGSSMQVTSINSTANVQLGMVQWSDDHSADTSNHKGSNDQSGTNSQVQAHITAEANAIAWGSIAQSVLHNVGTTVLNGPETNRAYSVFVDGGF